MVGLLRSGALGAAVGLSACGQPSIAAGPLESEIRQVGDTTVVEVSSGSEWGRPARLVEALRIGELEGSADYTLGTISHVAVSAAGEIFVFDEASTQLLRFSPNGAAMGQIGRDGEGPGEYGPRVTGLVVVGVRLILSDLSNGKISSFSTDGQFGEELGDPTRLRNQFEAGVMVRPESEFAVRILMTLPGPEVDMPSPWPIGFEARGADGQVLDTIRPQDFMGAQSNTLDVTPWGGLLVDSENEFLFELREPDGSAVRVHLPFERVPYSEAEVADLGPTLRAIAAADGSSDADAPKLKGTYLEYLYGEDRVWARRPARDTGSGWALGQYQASVMDVFRRDGTYLGEVPLPARTRPVAVEADFLYAIQLGEFDEPYIIKYRVEPPS